MSNLIPIEIIENKIYLIRGQKVMLDSDLAKLYRVKTKALNQSVKRNIKRFPQDFMFRLTQEETLQYNIYNSRSQIVTLKQGSNIKYLPYVFTEQGIVMLSGILNSDRAIQVNIVIMRVFVKLRQILSTHKDLAHKLKDLESKYEKHDVEIQNIFDAMRKMIEIEEKPKRKIGFQSSKDDI